MLLFYDFALTIADEINIIWNNPYKRLSTTLYFLNRYLPFTDTLIGLYITLSVTTPEMCHRYYSAITWLMAVGLMVSEVILLLRTWALVGKAKWPTVVLCCVALGAFGPGIAITYLEISSLRFHPVPLGGLGCNLVESSIIIVVAYTLIGFSETIVVGFTIAKGKPHIRTKNSSQSWVSHIYRDGLFFYSYLLCITIINIIVPIAAGQPRFRNYLAMPQRVFHSIFCTRVLLHIEARRDEIATTHDLDDTRRRSISKTNFTGNILDSVALSNISRDIEFQSVQSEPGDTDHELNSYPQDWTR